MASAKFESSVSWMHSNFCITDFNVMSESVLSGVLELELPSLARLLTLVGILMDERPNLTGTDSYASVAIAWSRALRKRKLTASKTK